MAKANAELFRHFIDEYVRDLTWKNHFEELDLMGKFNERSKTKAPVGTENWIRKLIYFEYLKISEK